MSEEFQQGKGQGLKKIKILEYDGKRFLVCSHRYLGHDFTVEITKEFKDFLKSEVLRKKKHAEAV